MIAEQGHEQEELHAEIQSRRRRRPGPICLPDGRPGPVNEDLEDQNAAKCSKRRLKTRKDGETGELEGGDTQRQEMGRQEGKILNTLRSKREGKHG